ncbi:nucleotidyltransferase family protein [Virgibacillus sp. SK37]|uniref:nucleotidyltransferase family protein n=1 Tax=Virgibacillus sp. SK37 TaxID=403957 RepID=UPI0011A81C68|nr:nucleotidyltransferase domain-containing protein [Virgibacillus sp. SK37]
MKSDIQKRDQILLQLKQIVLETLKDVPVSIYLFGSWARNEEKRTSDIDIALRPQKEIPMKEWVELRERIEESTVPYKVDLVDLSKANSNIVEKVGKEGIVWRDCSNDLRAQTGH